MGQKAQPILSGYLLNLVYLCMYMTAHELFLENTFLIQTEHRPL